MKITYGDKTGINAKTNHTNQVWDDDMNEIKTVVNTNNTIAIGTTTTVLLDNIQGRRYGSFASPLTGDITINTAGIEEFGCAAVVWQGSANPTISGMTIENYQGTISSSGTYSILILNIDNRAIVKIVGADSSGGVTEVVPTLTITD